MRKYITTITLAILTLIIIFVAYMEAEKYMKMTAVADCLHTAKIELVNGKQTINTPENYWYTFCMKEKGFK